MNFIAELKRRNVIRVAVAYTVAAWLLAQVFQLAAESFEAPAWVMKMLITALVIGLPVVLVFSWAYEITPEGLKREKSVAKDASITHETGKKLNILTSTLLILAIGFMALDRFVLQPRQQAPVQAVAASGAPAPAEPGSISPMEPDPIATNSIAVLPFANRSNLEDDLFFTDGIHDDLLTQLAKIADLKVISRTSVMEYRDTTKKIPQIAAELGVGKILEGGVQRAGKRIRINAQLIDVATDEHLWAETFDREMTVENIFDIQSEITRHIVTAVRGELTTAESQALAAVPTANLEAYEAFLQARNLASRPDYNQDKYINAQPWAERAVALDPGFARAWSLLTQLHGMAMWMGYDNSPERLAAMKRALDRAVLLDPDSPWTLMAQSEYKYRVESDFPAALAYLQKARELLPGDVNIIERIGITQRRMGLWNEAVDSLLQAVEMDPGNSSAATLAIETLESMRDWDRIQSLTGKWAVQFPDARDLQISRAWSFINGAGDLAAAHAIFDRVPATNSDDYFNMLVYLSQFERDFEAVLRILDTPEIRAVAKNRGWLGWREWTAGLSLRALGRAEEASAEFRKGLESFAGWEPTGVRNTDGWDLCYLALLHAELGHESEAIEAAQRVVNLVPETVDALTGTNLAGFRAQVLGMTGHRDEALAEIERLLDTPAGLVRWQLYLDPNWDFFRDDERFNELIRPLNLDEARP